MRTKSMVILSMFVFFLFSWGLVAQKNKTTLDSKGKKEDKKEEITPNISETEKKENTAVLDSEKKSDEKKEENTTDKIEAKKNRKELSLEDRLSAIEEDIESQKKKKATKVYKSMQGLGPAASGIYHVEDGLSIGGYLDMVGTDYRSKHKKDMADLKRLVLYTGYKFNDWILFNSEVEFEHAGKEVYVEFAYVDLKFKEWAILRTGLQLVPMGLTNLLHEPTTYYSVNRSYTETLIIPTTWRETGLTLNGELFDKKLIYRTGVLSGLDGGKMSGGSFIRNTRQKGIESKVQNWAGVFNIDFKPIDGLLFGASIYSGNTTQGQGGNIDPYTKNLIETNISKTTELPNEVKLAYTQSQKGRNLAGSGTVHLTDAHLEWNYGPMRMRAVAVKGWMTGNDAQVVSRLSGDNIAQEVYGDYKEIAFDILSFFKLEHKLMLFVRQERVNTQSRTPNQVIESKKYTGNATCSNFEITICGPTSKYPNANFGGIMYPDSTQTTYGLSKQYPNPANNQRIHTIGLAYYPDPNVVFKLDFEWHDSAAKGYYTYSSQLNPNNNRVSQINLGLGLIF